MCMSETDFGRCFLVNYSGSAKLHTVGSRRQVTESHHGVMFKMVNRNSVVSS